MNLWVVASDLKVGTGDERMRKGARVAGADRGCGEEWDVGAETTCFVCLWLLLI